MIARVITLSLTFALFAMTAKADDLALIITNGNYSDNSVSSRSVSREHAELVDAYGGAGYEIIEARNLGAQDLKEMLESFVDRIDGKDRVVIHLSGRFVNSGTQNWLLPVDLRADSLLDVSYNAASVNTLLDVISDKAGRGLLVLAGYEGRIADDRLSSGISMSEIPQGILVIQAEHDALNGFMVGKFLRAQTPVVVTLGKRPEEIKAMGFLSPDMTFAKTTETAAPEPISPNGPIDANALIEQAIWMVAQQSGKREDYVAYLSRFPNGAYASVARERIAALTVPTEPAQPTAEDIEKGLNLSRAARREIQSNLTVLGFNTRGVDGIFGSGSRSAISSWQRDSGYEVTGYLDAAQIKALKEQADNRRAVIEIEDRRYWNATGRAGDKVGLEAYLDKYPNGIFASEARELLDAIIEEERAGEDEEAWTKAVDYNTADSYREYLRDFPNGRYAELAKQRIAIIDPNVVEENPEAQASERRLGLNPATKLLIESRLKGLGYNPGTVDGNFDATTRAAILKFQEDNRLPRSGYVDPATVRSLLVQ